MPSNQPFRHVDEHGRVNNLPQVPERKIPWWLRKKTPQEASEKVPENAEALQQPKPTKRPRRTKRPIGRLCKDTEDRLVSLLKKRGPLQADVVAKLLGMSASRVGYLTISLKTDGIIAVRKVSNRTIYYLPEQQHADNLDDM